ncbi:IS4 family transposase [Nodularia spumigena]|uniref:IS4 family transposase n=1 Tax=Nodularia spumigena TaxID=70799 RepID=UPI002B2098C0|nr:IS4 family transposase [Nodularia spumigena]MEA5557387.1 IS4 family transposase [Nodularia spumigena CH309]
MLPTFYKTHLKSQLNLAEYILLKIIIILLQSLKKVSLEALATALPIPIKFESRKRKIQRFLSLPNFTIEKIWFPIVKTFLEIYFGDEELIYVVMDRTAWGRINLFVISIVWDQRAIPVYFELLSKLGSSNFEEQSGILKKIIPIFNNYKICILGDREFCSIKLANWLREKGVCFCTRLKKSEFVEIKNEVWLDLNHLGLYPGVSFFLAGVKVTKKQGFTSFNVACKWKRKILGVAPKEGWFILTNLDSLELAISAYKKRFSIEEMFRDFKTGGYNLEDTKLTDSRLISMILLISIAYTSATIQGQEIKRKGIQNYIGRVKEYGRKERRHSSFYIGLSAQTWVNFIDTCRELVRALLKLSPNKLKYYQRGERAMRLILSAS